MSKKDGERQRSFRLPAEDLEWLDDIAKKIDSRPEQIGRVNANDVLKDIVRKARETGYGATQSA